MASEKNKHGGRLTIAVCTASVCYVLYMLHDTLNSPLIPQARPPFLLLTLSQKTKVHFVLLAAMFLFYTSTQHSIGDASRSARSHWLLQLNISSLFHTTVFEVINIKHVWNMIMSVHPSYYRIIWTDGVFNTVLYLGLYSSTWMHHIHSAHFKCFHKQSYLVWVGHPKTFNAYFESPGHTRHGNNDPMWQYELQSHMVIQ